MHQPKARDETGRRVRFYMALGLVAAATLMLQIIETENHFRDLVVPSGLNRGPPDAVNGASPRLLRSRAPATRQFDR